MIFPKQKEYFLMSAISELEKSPQYVKEYIKDIHSKNTTSNSIFKVKIDYLIFISLVWVMFYDAPEVVNNITIAVALIFQVISTVIIPIFLLIMAVFIVSDFSQLPDEKRKKLNKTNDAFLLSKNSFKKFQIKEIFEYAVTLGLIILFFMKGHNSLGTLYIIRTLFYYMYFRAFIVLSISKRLERLKDELNEDGTLR